MARFDIATTSPTNMTPITPIAMIEDVRLHNLRHTHGSLAAGCSLGFQIIVRLLGHGSTLPTMLGKKEGMSNLRSVGKLVVAGAVAVTVFVGGTAATRAADAVPVLLCPFGCGPIDSDTILMDQFIKEKAGVMLLPQETPGYIYNIREMGRNKNKWKYSIFATEDTLIQVA